MVHTNYCNLFRSGLAYIVPQRYAYCRGVKQSRYAFSIPRHLMI